jgi:hypothetical protein
LWYAGGANIPEIRVQRSVRWWNCEECCKVEHRELAGGNHSMAVVPLGSHFFPSVSLILIRRVRLLIASRRMSTMLVILLHQSSAESLACHFLVSGLVGPSRRLQGTRPIWCTCIQSQDDVRFYLDVYRQIGHIDCAASCAVPVCPKSKCNFG